MKRCTYKVLFLVITVTIALVWQATSPVMACVPNPRVIGPIPVNAPPGDPSHDYTFLTPEIDLAAYGYVQEEFFIEGSANTYNMPPGEVANVLSCGHPYRTRIVVRRPASPKRFNGTVLLEWQNVTAGWEIEAHWGPSWEHFLRSGYAWVGVSAQRVGVHQPGTGLRDWSPIRYGTLDVTAEGEFTADELSYDIYSQAAQSILFPLGTNPMGELPVRMVLAVGASQSAGYLSRYFNSIHPLHYVVDGFYLLVGGSNLRTDLGVKVFQVLTETDLGFGPSRRMPDSNNFRSWEIAAAAHSGYVSYIYRLPLMDRDGIPNTSYDCDQTPFSRIRTGPVLNIAYDHLVRWVKKGTPPPVAPKIEFASEDPPIIARDDYGMALGGIRLPDLEAPLAINTGTNSGATFCFLFGSYEPFDDATLRVLYPTHWDYVRAVKKSVRKNVKAGYMNKRDGWSLIEEAVRADIPPN